jgi:hypothetical protein
MKAFRVLLSRIDGASGLRVDGVENATWLLSRLSDFFVFKTSEPLFEVPNSADCSFLVAHSSQLSGRKFEKLLAGITEVKLVFEPALPATPSAD